jgi:hypothetical protein
LTEAGVFVSIIVFSRVVASPRFLWESGDGLAERFPARLTVRILEFGALSHLQERAGPNAGDFVGFLDVPVGEKRLPGRIPCDH